MATAPFQSPAPFCFSKPDEWPKWKRRFKQYRMASGLLEKSDEYQASSYIPLLSKYNLPLFHQVLVSFVETDFQI